MALVYTYHLFYTSVLTFFSQINTILSLFVGCLIDKFGGPLLLVILVSFCCTGSIVQAATATEKTNSYSLLVAGRVIATLGQGSLDITQHKIFATYFAPGKGFAVSMGMWVVRKIRDIALPCVLI